MTDDLEVEFQYHLSSKASASAANSSIPTGLTQHPAPLTATVTVCET